MKKKAEEPRFRLEMIQMDLIDPNPENKNIFNVNDIDYLATIIKDEGFTTPIEVIEKSDGRYEIISGHRRYAAMRQLNESIIPCYISSDIDSENDKNKRLISSNMAARRITPLETAKAINMYKQILKHEKFKGETRKKVAEYFNISESAVYRYESLLKLIPELQEYTNRPNAPYSCFREASMLTKSEQYALYKEIIALEAKEKGQDEEDIDLDDVTLSRTRIEQLINNTIRKKEYDARQSKTTDSAVIQEDSIGEVTRSDDDFTAMPKPVDDSTLSGFVVQKGAGKEVKEVVDESFFASPESDASYFRGLDSCIETISGYQNSFKKSSATKEFKSKINELKKAIAKLEAMF